LNLKDLGKSYWEWRAETEASEAEIPREDVAAAPDALLEEDIVSTYIRDDGKIPAQADKVEAFCPKITLRRLMTEAAGGGPSPELVALLDERGLDGGTISARPNQGPKTAAQLYQSLKEPRCHSNDTHPSDVRHRHVFLTDLDPWGICAIFGASPRYQMSALRSMVYRHLQPMPCIHVDIQPDGRRFELVFHLRYTLMRRSEEANIDPRRFTDGTPLREYCNVSYLDLKGNQRQTHCYEAQISYLLIGLDESTWDTYYVKDNYFNSGEDGESLTDIHDDVRQAADGMVVIDPSTRDEPEPDTPAPDPREKFLRTLRYHLERVKEVYTLNGNWVHHSVRVYAQSDHDRQNPPTRRPSNLKVQGCSTIEWITKVKDLSEMFLVELSDLVDVTDKFLCKYQNLFTTDLCSPLVSKIWDILEDLEELKKPLRDAKTKCESLDRNEQNRLKQLSAEAGRKNESLSRLFYLVATAAAMISMREHVLPLKPNAATFVCVLLFIGLLIVLSYDSSWFRQLLVRAADSVGSRRGSANSPPHHQSAEPPASPSPWSLQAAASV
jgi:hypothetical protein